MFYFFGSELRSFWALSVGKLRKKWLPQTVSDVGLTAMKAIKEELDPKNVFANGNLLEPRAKL